MSVRGLAVIVGVGVGVGGAVATRFARGGYRVAICARNQTYKNADKLTPLKEEIEREGGEVVCCEMDAADPASVSETFAKLGAVDVLVYNAGARDMAPVSIENTDPDKFLNYWKVNCFGAYLCSREVVRGMKERHKGTIIFTGATAALRGSAGMSTFSPGKFGLRSLSQTLRNELSPHNIHVCHVVIDGPVNIPLIRKYMKGVEDRLIEPKDVAEVYWQLHTQPSSCWTFEMDVRSASEPLTSSL
jgi:short-subunit dehydrogenase